MSQKFQKKLVKTLFGTVLFFAFVHLAILTFYSILVKKIELLNIFNILNLNFFFPGIGLGFASQILSVLAMLVVFAVVFFFFSD